MTHKNYLYLLLYALFFIPITTSAQKGIDTEKKISIVPFTIAYAHPAEEADYSLMLTERIQTAAVKSQRFNMVEFIDLKKRLEVHKIKWELDPTTEDLLNAGKLLDIDYIFTGSITNITFPIIFSGGYGCDVSFTIKVLSIKSGDISYNESFSVHTDKIIGKSSKREALNAALEKVIEPVSEFIDANFPIEVLIRSIKETNRKGIPKTIIINGGTSNGLRNGQKLDIALLDDTEDYREKIGEVEIIEIEAKYATCKIRENPQAVGKAINNENQIVIARSIAYKRKKIFKK